MLSKISKTWEPTGMFMDTGHPRTRIDQKRSKQFGFESFMYLGQNGTKPIKTENDQNRSCTGWVMGLDL